MSVKKLTPEIKQRSDRRDRSRADIDDLLAEISYAESILDGMGAKPGLTLWGRIGTIKDREEKVKDYFRVTIRSLRTMGDRAFADSMEGFVERLGFTKRRQRRKG